MTFEEWDKLHFPAPRHHNMILNGIERGMRHAGWRAGQEAMRERIVAALKQEWECAAEEMRVSNPLGAIRALPIE